jgi:uncharacterized membrane protein YdcZ (DUF606 family)
MGSWVVVAAAIGMAVGVQVTVLGEASRRFHPLTISLALQIAGVLVGGVWAIHQRAWSDILEVSLQWWWLPLGAIGWGIVAALGFAAARGGISATLAVVIGSQLVTGLALDQTIGKLDLSVRHLVGVALLVVGVVLVSARS